MMSPCRQAHPRGSYRCHRAALASSAEQIGPSSNCSSESPLLACFLFGHGKASLPAHASTMSGAFRRIHPVPFSGLPRYSSAWQTSANTKASLHESCLSSLLENSPGRLERTCAPQPDKPSRNLRAMVRTQAAFASDLFHRTSRVRFMVPRSFATHLGQSRNFCSQPGSQHHRPSTTNLNSWCPGGSCSVPVQ